MYIRETINLNGKEYSIETGRMAKQANGAVIVRYGDSMVLVTAVSMTSPRPTDFLPLTVDYQEKKFAAGSIPGGYFKRVGRLSEFETLTSRIIDRPCRPLFPKGWRFETQLIATVISSDKENPLDVLSLTGASTALTISNIPWDGPIAGVRVGRVNGEFIANPTWKQIDESEINIVMAASRDAIVMVEGSARNIPEDIMVDALFFGHDSVIPLLDLQEKIRAAVGHEKREFTPPEKDQSIEDKVAEIGTSRIAEAVFVPEKLPRYAKVKEVRNAIIAEMGDEYADRIDEIKDAVGSIKSKIVRNAIVKEGRRIDGRDLTTVRPITCEVGVLPRVHGSALFTRGETQALVAATLGTERERQRIEGLNGDIIKRFMLHYNFPPFSVAEAKFLRGAGRREIGHGVLAERALLQVLPTAEEFPYVLRVVSEILESNGSSSMAAVCGGCLSLMDAGVPISAPVAGIAMGLVQEGDDVGILTDILGDEDHLGDMDFKVTGTREGITALQMDIKVKGLSRELMRQALSQARDGRLHILDEMDKALAAPREDLSQHAPRIVTVKVKPDQIRNIIGPGGKTIKAIVEQTGASVDVNDSGVVSIASSDASAAQKAIDIIKGLTQEPEIGEYYLGTVRRITEFGAFVEILPGLDGLVHISEMARERIDRVEDVCKEGEEMVVKVLNVDNQGKIRLSRREALDKSAEDVLSMVRKP